MTLEWYTVRDPITNPSDDLFICLFIYALMWDPLLRTFLSRDYPFLSKDLLFCVSVPFERDKGKMFWISCLSSILFHSYSLPFWQDTFPFYILDLYTYPSPINSQTSLHIDLMSNCSLLWCFQSSRSIQNNF